MAQRTPFIILNGFDRSGTSMVAKVLAKHPEVELLFQPDNSTILHRSQWERWSPDYRCSEAESFFQGLLSGHVDRSFIQSDWFRNHSTTYDVIAGRLHAIKSTKLHFKVDWLQANFPEIDIFAIVRDPRATVCSLVRNGFHRSWYGDSAYEKLVEYCEGDAELSSELEEQVYRAQDDLEKIAAIVAVRTDVMMRSIPSGRVIAYEDVLGMPDEILNGVIRSYEISWFHFEAHIEQDYNPVGKYFQRTDLWRDYFCNSDIKKLNAIFSKACVGDYLSSGGKSI